MQRVLKIEHMRNSFFAAVLDDIYEAAEDCDMEEAYELVGDDFKQALYKRLNKTLDEFLKPRDFFKLPDECLENDDDQQSTC